MHNSPEEHSFRLLLGGSLLNHKLAAIFNSSVFLQNIGNLFRHSLYLCPVTIKDKSH